MKQRAAVSVIASLILSATAALSQASAPLVTVFKTSTCGCCGKWVEHLKANGFDVKVQDVNDATAYARQYHVPLNLESCHTALVNGYVIEGHVPAKEIKRLLAEHPKSLGLAVPGMPAGSPGMEGARSESYSVFLFDQNGAASVYARYPDR
ncbi:MAG TPA: DUF411 domain-containing protein [Terriglobales bacterium]|nr:DUF411 domain-containing protein [Terriglobales bacterium]